MQQRGELDGDYAVPVEIRTSLSKDDSLRIATVENLQRQNLTPLEETAALTKLIHKGATLDDVAARTGLSQTTIKRRLALNGLCDEAKAGLAILYSPNKRKIPPVRMRATAIALAPRSGAGRIF